MRPIALKKKIMDFLSHIKNSLVAYGVLKNGYDIIYNVVTFSSLPIV